MKIKLIVIRTQDPENLANLYSLLGLSFEYHKHGNSPYHYSVVLEGVVLEIYPLMKAQAEADKYLRLGFEIDEFDSRIALLNSKGFLFSEPIQTDFGIMAITIDPDGRKIELYKKV